MQLTSKIKIKHGWRTEWCSHMPIIDGDAQIDDATWEYRPFPTLAEAEAYAAKVMKEHSGGAYGCVQIDEFEWTPIERESWVSEFALIGETIEVTP